MKVKKLVKANISQLFTVEKVLDKKQKSGKTFFLIKWQSYSDDFNSWEPKSNLMLCPELIEEYEKEHAKEARCTGKIQLCYPIHYFYMKFSRRKPT